MKRKLGCDVKTYIDKNGKISSSDSKGKRLEENYKMIFKSAFKALSSRFRTQTKGKRSKSDETSFYNYYFNCENSDTSIPIESFFHPNR